MIDAQDHIPPDSSCALQAAQDAFDGVLGGASTPEAVREALAAAVQAALAARDRELQAAIGRIDVLSESLADMVRQFGLRADGGLRHTGGIAALEGAFAALGLTDPHPIADDAEPCDEPDCLQRAVVGFPSNEHGFRRTCWDHASPDAADSAEPLIPPSDRSDAVASRRRTAMSLLVMQQMLQGSNPRRTT